MRVLTTLQEAGYPTYLVGGSVRDLLRGVAPKDFDLATAALPEQVQACFRRVLPTGLQHGTVTVLLNGHQVEVTTFRSEGLYLDGRRPSEIAFHDDVEADLARRDFTINAMAYDPRAKRLVDPFDGRGDLLRHLVRCVGEPSERFGEDGLRVVRAVRIATVLEFDLDGPTEAAISGALTTFDRIARERVTDELVKLLNAARADRGLRLLRRTGLTRTIFGEGALEDGPEIDHAVALCPSELEARLALWLGLGQRGLNVQALMEKLVLSRRSQDAVTRLSGRLRLAELADASEGTLRRVLATHPADEVPLVAEVGRAAAPVLGLDPVAAVTAGTRLRALLAENPPLQPRDLALNGAAIMRVLAIPPSRRVGEATRFLMERVLDEPSLNTESALTGLLGEFAATDTEG